MGLKSYKSNFLAKKAIYYKLFEIHNIVFYIK